MISRNFCEKIDRIQGFKNCPNQFHVKSELKSSFEIMTLCSEHYFLLFAMLLTCSKWNWFHEKLWRLQGTSKSLLITRVFLVRKETSKTDYLSSFIIYVSSLPTYLQPSSYVCKDDSIMLWNLRRHQRRKWGLLHLWLKTKSWTII